MSLLPLDLIDSDFDSHPIIIRPKPPQIDACMLERAITLPFQPNLTENAQPLNSLAELNVDEITHKYKYRAAILNLFGPVVKDYREKPRPEIIEKVREIHQKMLLCLLPQRNQPIPEDLIKMGIPIAYSVSTSTNPRCYETISDIYLQNRNPHTGGLHANEHLVIGSNYLTDLSCRDTGMDYLYVTPQRGIESKGFDLLRSYAEKVVSFHDFLRRLKNNTFPPREKQINTSYINPYTTPYCRGQNALKRLK